MSNKIRRSIVLHKWFDKTLKEDDIIKFDFSAYENIQEIGRGGFGIVYSAYHGGKRYALKTFKNDETNKEVTKDFIKEQVIPGTPTDYANLYRKCWNALPKERPTISKILEILNSISKRGNLQYITNRNKGLIPALDITINEQPQFYKTMHTDDLAKTLIRTTSILKPRRPSNSSSKVSVDSLTKTSSATSLQKTRDSSLSGSKNSKGSINKSLRGFFFGYKKEDHLKTLKESLGLKEDI
ncbi:27923_t:CDS:2 [Gigaspora margarita]|uniref:27923_t:CDS:1 n=1 Tax=Gigaspora margarita TaxID=4874 RepID=A0ABN7UWS1_GIGMA|nr:27923_t:CDS:2 [Gigaspora margarita]